MISDIDARKCLEQRGQLFTDQNTDFKFSEFELVLLNTLLTIVMTYYDPQESNRWDDMVKFESQLILEMRG